MATEDRVRSLLAMQNRHALLSASMQALSFQVNLEVAEKQRRGKLHENNFEYASFMSAIAIQIKDFTLAKEEFEKFLTGAAQTMQEDYVMFTPLLVSGKPKSGIITHH